MESPLLEKLHLPPNWRLYRTELMDWYIKYFALPRPIVILPKEIPENKVEETDNDKIISELKPKRASHIKHDDKEENNVKHRHSSEEDKSIIHTDDTAGKDDTGNDDDKKQQTREQEPSNLVDGENHQHVAQQFPLQSMTDQKISNRITSLYL